MKKTTRVLVALLALTLVTSCFVGGTFAKYVTEATGTDTARVAAFGVVLTAESDVFAPEYAGNDEISVKAADTADLVAPGTEGTMTAFTLAGAPEVNVKITATLNALDQEGNETLSMVTLPASTYRDWTDADPEAKYELGEAYYPVVWTLTQKTDAESEAQVMATGNLAAIETYLDETLSGEYDVESTDFDALNGTWTLSWAWAFDENNRDAEDTTLGQMAAGVEDEGNAVLNETFNFSIKVEQLD